MEEWLVRLNEEEAYTFELGHREEIEEQIRMNQLSFALQLNEDGYEYLVGQESQYLAAVDQHVDKIFRTYLMTNEFDTSVDLQNIVDVETESLSDGTTNSEESSAHAIVGMTLYFSMYTVLFSLMS